MTEIEILESTIKALRVANDNLAADRDELRERLAEILYLATNGKRRPR
jgi:hypothetical protein